MKDKRNRAERGRVGKAKPEICLKPRLGKNSKNLAHPELDQPTAKHDFNKSGSRWVPLTQPIAVPNSLGQILVVQWLFALKGEKSHSSNNNTIIR